MKESYEWVSSCIASSTNKFQFDCCKKLIDLFSGMYGKTEGYPVYEVWLTNQLDDQEVKYSLDA